MQRTDGDYQRAGAWEKGKIGEQLTCHYSVGNWVVGIRLTE